MSLNIQGLGQKAKKDWVKELCFNNKVNFLANQETKMEKIDIFSVRSCWGNSIFEHLHSNSMGNSRGILCVWDPNAFRKYNHTISDYFVIIRGVWLKNGIDLTIIAVYAPHDPRDKFMLWEYLGHVVNQWHGEVPFRFFHHWLELDGFYTFVSDTWRNTPKDRSNGTRNMTGKLKFLKSKIRKWIKDNRCNRKVAFDKLKEDLRLVDEAIDKGIGTEELKREVTIEEIKTAVWNCGADKSPGPDRFTFNFNRQFWSTIDKDVLINVLGDIVSEVQSAFVTGRQILDGLFLLNEVLHWCSKKRQKSLIFKRVVDVGLFKGIELNHSLCLSHMFYAEDAIFMGQWSDGNITTLIHVLECFFHVSGLKINLSKNSIWMKVITAIHGVNGNVNSSREKASRSCWLAIMDEVRALHKKVKYVPIKVNILAWKIRCDVLPTRMNLSRRGIDIQAISCPICDYGVESSDHLFFRCNMIRDIGYLQQRFLGVQVRGSQGATVDIDSKVFEFFDCPGNKVLREVTAKMIATGVWSKLETLYMTKSLANKLYMKKKLYTFYMSTGRKISEHMDEFNQIVFDLTDIETKSKGNQRNVYGEGGDGEGLYVRGRTGRREALLGWITDSRGSYHMTPRKAHYSGSDRLCSFRLMGSVSGGIIKRLESQVEDHTSDWLMVVLIFGLGQTVNIRTYQCVLCYRLGVPVFFVLKPCSACFRFFARDIYREHVVACAGMIDCVSGHVVIKAAQCIRVKYEAKLQILDLVQHLLPWVNLVSHLGDHYRLVVSDLGQLHHLF
nr:RNA-directed DNA polymerase, eukaryota [Tanacetum cinerariifolium]